MRVRFVMGLLSGLRVVWPILSALLALMVTMGIVVGLRQGWSLNESIDFSFVTGLTIGYGDLAPRSPITRALAIAIGLCGALMMAPIAAIAVKALDRVSD